MDTQNPATQFMSDFSALKLRNRNLRKELIRQVRELACDVSDATAQVIGLDFELLSCEDDRLTDDFVTFDDAYESAGKLENLVPKDNLHWDIDYATLLKDTNRLESLTSPGVLRAYWTISAMGLWD